MKRFLRSCGYPIHLKNRSSSFEIRTSTSYPIEVTYIPNLPFQGELGITITPGKWTRPRTSTSDHLWKRDLIQDITDLKEKHGVSLVISLLNDADYFRYYRGHGYNDVKRYYLDQWVDNLRYAIPNRQVPEDLPSFHRLIEEIIVRLKNGENIVIHGVTKYGLTGIIIAGCLIYSRFGLESVIKYLREHNPKYLSSPEQIKFLHSYTLFLRKKSAKKEKDFEAQYSARWLDSKNRN